MWLREHATVASKQGAMVLPEPVSGHRVGWHPSYGLVFAEGHPAGAGKLCPPGELVTRGLDLQDALMAAGLPLSGRERAFESLNGSSEGWAGLSRVDATVNLRPESGAVGLAVLSGIAACVRDQPGKAQVIWGAQRAVETVYLLGHSGKRKLGRWYDKSVQAEATSALAGPRGTLIRGEDQRRWGKGDRRDPWELTAASVKTSFQRRFYPLWKASKGVTVAGPMIVVEKLLEHVDAGEITLRESASILHEAMLTAYGQPERMPKRTRNRLRAKRRELGLALADGVLQEVEVDVAAVLEAALETDAWERRG